MSRECQQSARLIFQGTHQGDYGSLKHPKLSERLTDSCKLVHQATTSSFCHPSQIESASINPNETIVEASEVMCAIQEGLILEFPVR